MAFTKVRNERNQARDEVKQLRSSLEVNFREKKDLEAQISQLKIEMEKVHLMLLKHAGQHKEEERDISSSPIDHDGLKNVNSEGLVTKAASSSLSENENSIDVAAGRGVIPKYVRADSKSEDVDDDHDYLTQKVKMLHLRLEDANKTIYSEKE